MKKPSAETVALEVRGGDIMKMYFVREIDPLENGTRQYGVFEYEGVEGKPHIQLNRPKMIEVFAYEWRAIRFMNEKMGVNRIV